MSSYVEVKSIGWQEYGQVILEIDSIKAVLSIKYKNEDGAEYTKHKIYYTDKLYFETDDEGFNIIKERLRCRSYNNFKDYSYPEDEEV